MGGKGSGSGRRIPLGIVLLAALAIGIGSSSCVMGGGLRIGAAVATLPHGFVSLSFTSGPFFFHDGYFYRPHGPGYVVVHPPYGIIVPVLPHHGVRWMTVRGVRYAHYRGIYYRPVRRNRTTVYMVVDLR